MPIETTAEIENQTYGTQLIAQEPPSNQMVTHTHVFPVTTSDQGKNLNVPARYLDDQKQKSDEPIGKLKRKRPGKKSVITMKINQMNKVIEGHGCKTKLKFLYGKLLEDQSEVTDLHQ